MTKDIKIREKVARYRAKAAAAGSQRVEVTVPAGDVSLMKALASVLRAGGAPAEQVREAIKPIAVGPKARTGAELVAFFRASPLVNANLTFERDQSSRPPLDLE